MALLLACSKYTGSEFVKFDLKNDLFCLCVIKTKSDLTDDTTKTFTHNFTDLIQKD